MIGHSSAQENSAHWATCTIAMDGGGFCDKPKPVDSPLSLCELHLAQAHLYCADKIANRRDAQRIALAEAEVARVRAAHELALAADALDAETVDDEDSVVYYIQFGDRVKIGFSRNLRDRLSALPYDRLIGTEPGGRQVEARRHRQFAEHRISGEWFHAASEIVELAESLPKRETPGWLIGPR